MSRLVHPPLAPRRGGARAVSWWGRAWVRALEEAAYGEPDLRRGRALARQGAVGGIAVEAGSAVAAVTDAAPSARLHTAQLGLPVLDEEGRASLVEVVAAQVGRLGALLGGDLPHDLVEHAEELGVELLPFGGELETTCTCEAWTDPCPHALALLSQLAWLVDADPFVLLHLRGVPREELLAALHARGDPGRRAGAEPREAEDPVVAVALDVALDAAERAARILELAEDPTAGVEHLL